MGKLVDLVKAFKECRTNSKQMEKVAQLVNSRDGNALLNIWEASKKADPNKIKEIKECADAVRVAREVSPLNRTPEQLKLISKFENRGFWQNFKTQIADMRFKTIDAQIEKGLKKSPFNFGGKTSWGLLIGTGIFALGMLALMTKDSWLPKVKELLGTKKDNKAETESVVAENEPIAAEVAPEAPKTEVKEEATAEVETEEVKPVVTQEVKVDVNPEVKVENAPAFHEVKNGDGLLGIANKHLKTVLRRRPNEIERKAYIEEIIKANQDKKLKWNEAHTAVSITPGMKLIMPEWNQTMAVDYARDLKSASTQPQVKEPVKVTKAQVSDTNRANVVHVADTNAVKAKLEKKEASVKDSVQQELSKQQSKQASNTNAKTSEDQNAAYLDSVSTEYNKVLSFNKPLRMLEWADSNYKNHITPLKVDAERAMTDKKYLDYIHSEEFLKDKEKQQVLYEKWLEDTVYPEYNKYVDSLYRENKKQIEEQNLQNK